MGRLLCWFGIHDWWRQENIRGGTSSNVVIVAMLAEILNPRRCDRECLRCGKVKEFVYDSRR